MSGQRPRQGTSRNNNQPRTSSLPASLLPHLRQPPSSPLLDDDEPRHTLPSPQYVPTRPILPSLSPILHPRPSSSSRLPSLRETHEGQRAPFLASDRSLSASPVSEDFDDRQHFSAAYQYRQDTTSNVRAAPPLQQQQYQQQQPSLPRAHGLYAPARPHSALDTAYLSDLSTASATSSLRGAPPPSHASTSSSSSLTSVRSWRRAQDHAIGERLGASASPALGRLVGPGTRIGVIGGDAMEAGLSHPTQFQEVEYEARSGRRAHFPVSTMRGGSSRAYSSYLGISEASRPRGGWGADEDESGGSPWSGSEQDIEMSTQARGRGRGRVFRGSGAYRGEFSGGVSSSTSPRERSMSPHRVVGSHASSSVPNRQEQQYLGWAAQTIPEGVPETRREARSSSTQGFRIDATFSSSERYPRTQELLDTSRDQLLSTSANVGPSHRSTRPAVYARSSVSETPSTTSRSSSSTSLPRRSAYPAAGPYQAYLEGAPRPHHQVSQRGVIAPPAPLGTAFPLSPVSPLPQPYRSFTFPATSDERERPPERYAPAEGTYAPVSSLDSRLFLRGPGQGSPPPVPTLWLAAPLPTQHTYSATPYQPFRTHADSQPVPAPTVSHAQSQGLRPPSASPQLSLSAPTPGYATDTLSFFERYEAPLIPTPRAPMPTPGRVAPPRAPASASPRVPVPSASSALGREQRTASGNVQVQYPYPPEAPPLSRYTLPSPLPPLAVPAKRARTISAERSVPGSSAMPSAADSSAVSAPGPPSSIAPAPRGRGRKSGTGRGRSIKAAAASDSASRSRTQTPLQAAGFHGREERIAHAAAFADDLYASGGPPTSVPSTSRPIGPSIRPQLLVGKPALPPVAGPSGTSRSLEKKGEKGKEKERGKTPGKQGSTEASVMEGTSEEDEEYEDEGPEFLIGAAPLQSVRARRRAPRAKIDVACDFCRKRKMRCDGGRPSCKNCVKKNEACTYINEVRRRGPGRKTKIIAARPKKTNKTIEASTAQAQAKKLTKGKGKAKAQTVAAESGEVQLTPVETRATNDQQQQQLQMPRTPPPPALHESGGADYSLSTPTQPFIAAFSSTANANELFLPSPLQLVSPPRAEGPSLHLHGHSFTPLQSSMLSLAPYSPTPMSFYVHNSPHAFGTDLFLAHSPTLGADVVDPVVHFHAMPESSAAAAARTASVLSSGPSSSEGELRKRSRRRRAAKRVKVDQQRDDDDLEEGEIREAGPSGIQQQVNRKSAPAGDDDSMHADDDGDNQQ